MDLRESVGVFLQEQLEILLKQSPYVFINYKIKTG